MYWIFVTVNAKLLPIFHRSRREELFKHQMVLRALTFCTPAQAKHKETLQVLRLNFE